MGDKRCHAISSFGSLKHFRASNKVDVDTVFRLHSRSATGSLHICMYSVHRPWSNCKTSTFTLLANACHYVDFIQAWMGDKRCLAVSSFGSPTHFAALNKVNIALHFLQPCLSHHRFPLHPLHLRFGRFSMTLYPMQIYIHTLLFLHIVIC